MKSNLILIILVLAIGRLGTADGQNTGSSPSQGPKSDEPIKISAAELVNRIESATDVQRKKLTEKIFETTFRVENVRTTTLEAWPLEVESSHYSGGCSMAFRLRKDSKQRELCENLNKGETITVRFRFTNVDHRVSMVYRNESGPDVAYFTDVEILKVGK